VRRLSFAHLFAAAAPALLVVTFLVGSAPDEEEFRWGILSSFLHARALAGGTLLSWTSTPQPASLGHLEFHPRVDRLLSAMTQPERVAYAPRRVGRGALGGRDRLRPRAAVVRREGRIDVTLNPAPADRLLSRR
jgi:hypothetical protein